MMGGFLKFVLGDNCQAMRMPSKIPSAIRHSPEKCCIRRSAFSPIRPCVREMPKLKLQNHVVVPSATPATHAAFGANASATQY